MSNKLFVKNQICRMLTWFFGYDKLTKLKTTSMRLFNNIRNELLVNLNEVRRFQIKRSYYF